MQTWQSFMDQSCCKALKKTPWACMLANYSLPYISSSSFIVEAQTDQTVYPLNSPSSSLSVQAS